MKFSFLILIGFFIIQTNVFASPVKVDCYAGGGGYVVQKLKVTDRLKGGIDIQAELFTPVPEIVIMPDLGFKIDRWLARSISLNFGPDQCHEKKIPNTNIALQRCSTDIQPGNAELVLVDGTTKTVKLANNNRFEMQYQTTESVSQIEKLVRVSFSLGVDQASTALGFRQFECR